MRLSGMESLVASVTILLFSTIPFTLAEGSIFLHQAKIAILFRRPDFDILNSSDVTQFLSDASLCRDETVCLNLTITTAILTPTAEGKEVSLRFSEQNYKDVWNSDSSMTPATLSLQARGQRWTLRHRGHHVTHTLTHLPVPTADQCDECGEIGRYVNCRRQCVRPDFAGMCELMIRENDTRRHTDRQDMQEK